MKIFLARSGVWWGWDEHVDFFPLAAEYGLTATLIFFYIGKSKEVNTKIIFVDLFYFLCLPTTSNAWV